MSYRVFLNQDSDENTQQEYVLGSFTSVTYFAWISYDLDSFFFPCTLGDIIISWFIICSTSSSILEFEEL